jgi:hypothetical protein
MRESFMFGIDERMLDKPKDESCHILYQERKSMKYIFKGFFQKPDEHIVVVSGLPRSGTSMMMKIMEAGGIPPLIDGLRTADSDNPKGYYEFERVKKLKEGDTAWLPDARGKAVKIISALLQFLPSGYDYRVVFMRRSISEILASQRKMLINRGSDPNLLRDNEMAVLFQKHLKHTETWVKTTARVQYIFMDYNQMLSDPEPHLRQLNQFFGGKLNMDSMLACIDPSLYRQRI